MEPVNMSIYGYFTSAEQDTPAFDPGLQVDCPMCGKVLAQESLCHSVMWMGHNRSYFYRYCKTHRDELDFDDTRDEIDGKLLDSLMAYGDLS